jgi:methionine-S-sulfoxide reductase
MMKVLISIIAGLVVIAGLATGATMDKQEATMGDDQGMTARAIFAGGCFWCMEPPFKKLDGVHAVVSGYIAGHKENPTYQEVSSGTTGHTEAVEISYDPAKVSFDELLEVFWMNIDPTDAGGQFVDRGSQYRSGIYYLDDEQKRLAEASKERLDRSGRFDSPVVTEIVAATRFYPAEDYHQDYYRESPIRYKFYRYNSGRDQFINRVWGKDES